MKSLFWANHISALFFPHFLIIFLGTQFYFFKHCSPKGVFQKNLCSKGLFFQKKIPLHEKYCMNQKKGCMDISHHSDLAQKKNVTAQEVCIIIHDSRCADLFCAKKTTGQFAEQSNNYIP